MLRKGLPSWKLVRTQNLREWKGFPSIPEFYGSSHPPFQSGHFFGRFLLEFWQGPVLFKPFIVQELPHGDVGKLLHQLERLADVEEHGEEMLTGPRAHFDPVWQEQRGVLLQLSDVHPPDHQLG